MNALTLFYSFIKKFSFFTSLSLRERDNRVRVFALLMFLLFQSNFCFGIEKAPDFTLPDLKGNLVTLSKYKGKVVLLNFWATWCPPCREEMPSLQKLYNAMKKNNFTMLTVSIDGKKSTVENFIKEQKYTFPVLLDLDRKAIRIYNPTGIPATCLINKKGEIVLQEVGSRDWADKEIIDKINKLIK